MQFQAVSRYELRIEGSRAVSEGSGDSGHAGLLSVSVTPALRLCLLSFLCRVALLFLVSSAPEMADPRGHLPCDLMSVEAEIARVSRQLSSLRRQQPPTEPQHLSTAMRGKRKALVSTASPVDSAIDEVESALLASYMAEYSGMSGGELAVESERLQTIIHHITQHNHSIAAVSTRTMAGSVRSRQSAAPSRQRRSKSRKRHSEWSESGGDTEDERSVSEHEENEEEEEQEVQDEEGSEQVAVEREEQTQQTHALVDHIVTQRHDAAT